MPFSIFQPKWYDVGLPNQADSLVCCVVDPWEPMPPKLTQLRPQRIILLWHDRHEDHSGEHAHVDSNEGAHKQAQSYQGKQELVRAGTCIPNQSHASTNLFDILVEALTWDVRNYP